MKKIVALALCLIMALSLATVAFGTVSAQTYDVYVANSTNISAGAIATGATAAATDVAIETHAAVTGLKGDGSVEYYVYSNSNYVKTTSPVNTDLAVAKKDSKTIEYYLTPGDNVEYAGSAVAYTDFGTGCGQVFKAAGDTNDYYKVTAGNGLDAGDVYVNAAGGNTALLVKGKVVLASAVAEAATKGTVGLLKHSWTMSNSKYEGGAVVPTEATCVYCGAKTTAVYKNNKVPAGCTGKTLAGQPVANAYVVVETAAGTTAAAGVTSAKTFDAGVALYAGMALMSVAGSAVVIGKKKEF